LMIEGSGSSVSLTNGSPTPQKSLSFSSAFPKKVGGGRIGNFFV
jgi:hypothetical protein